MYPIEKRIPNLLTFTNLFCGFVAIASSLAGDLVLAGWMILFAATADLFDGLAARLLNAQSAIGAQLDSLSDMVSFGVAPALLAYMLLIKTHAGFIDSIYLYEVPLFALIAFLLLAASAYRLAKFNVKNGSDADFHGLPTPANAIFFASLPLMLQYQVFVVKFDIYSISDLVLSPYFIIGSILLLSWLMISNIPMFSLKLSNFKGGKAKIIISFISLSVLLFVFLIWAAIPLIILLYVIFSLFTKNTRHEIQSAD